MVVMILDTAGGTCIIFLFGRPLSFNQKNIEVDVDVDFFGDSISCPNATVGAITSIDDNNK